MRDKTLTSVLMMVGFLCIIGALMLYFSGRVNKLMDVFYPLVFGVIFLGEFVRVKYFKKSGDD